MNTEPGGLKTKHFSKSKVAFVAMMMFAFVLYLAPTNIVQTKVAHAAQCSTANVTPRVLSTFSLSHRNALDVYGTTDSSGYFLYYDHYARSWRGIKWSPWSLLDNNGVRFGVSTAWAFGHPWWGVTSWRYIYPC